MHAIADSGGVHRFKRNVPTYLRKRSVGDKRLDILLRDRTKRQPWGPKRIARMKRHGRTGCPNCRPTEAQSVSDEPMPPRIPETSARLPVRQSPPGCGSSREAATISDRKRGWAATAPGQTEPREQVGCRDGCPAERGAGACSVPAAATVASAGCDRPLARIRVIECRARDHAARRGMTIAFESRDPECGAIARRR